MDVIPFTDRQAIFARLEQTASRLNMNSEERIRYNDELKKYRDYFSTIDYAKESGIREGIANKSVEIARNLLALGTMNKEQIASVTGLTLTEVEAL